MQEIYRKYASLTHKTVYLYNNYNIATRFEEQLTKLGELYF